MAMPSSTPVISDPSSSPLATVARLEHIFDALPLAVAEFDAVGHADMPVGFDVDGVGAQVAVTVADAARCGTLIYQCEIRSKEALAE